MRMFKIIAAAALCLSAASAQAASYLMTVSGTVRTSNGVAGAAGIGGSFTAKVVYDTSIAPYYLHNSGGYPANNWSERYYEAQTSFTLTSGSFSKNFGALDRYFGSVANYQRMYHYASGGGSMDFWSRNSINEFVNIQLIGTAGLASADLPTSAAGLPRSVQFASQEWQLDYQNAGQQLTGDITSITIQALGVPEPAQWALMIGGFGLVGAASRRRRATVAA